MCSGANFGDGLALPSTTLGIDGILDMAGDAEGVVLGVARRCAGMGRIGIDVALTDDVAGGGWSVPDGSVVLMKKAKVEPLPGDPFALMSPPCR